MTNTLYNLTPEQFTELQESGVLYALFPNAPLSVPAFIAEQRVNYLNETAYLVVQSIVDMTGADPEEIFDLFTKYKDRIIQVIENLDEVDVSGIIEAIREDT